MSSSCSIRRARTTAATWGPGCTRIRSTRTTSSAPNRSPRCLCRRLVPASVSVDNRTERLQAEVVSGNYFSMLGIKPAIGRVFNFPGRRSGLPWASRRRVELRLLGQPVCTRSERHRQEDPRQRFADDDRRRVSGGICRHRSHPVAADSRAGAHETGDDARVDLAAARRSPRALGAGLRAAETWLHG